MLRIHQPASGDPLGQWLQLVWEWNGYRSPSAHERILPHGQVEVSWNLRAPHRFRLNEEGIEVPRAALLGARSSAYLVDTRRPAHLFGFVFRPGVACAFFGVSVFELGLWIGPLSQFRVGRELEARVGDARSAAERLRAVRAYFAGLNAPPRPREANAVLEAWSSPQGRHRSVRSIHQALGMSAPTFVDRVRRQLGFRPAQLRQVLMFREAVSVLAHNTETLADVAHTTGYCDQAHLNRAFRRHAGITPHRFRPHLADHPFNVPEPEPVFSFDPIAREPAAPD